LIEFEYVSKNNREIIFKNKGLLMYSNSKYRITLDDIIFIFDGNKHYNIIKENMEVNVLKSNELSNYVIPSNLSKILEKNKKELKVLLNEKIIISYVDENDYKYKIEVDKKFNILRIDQELSNTYSNSIFFNKTSFNQNLDINLFVFSESDYEGYYINEL
tara:strand:- start:62 stop:541 length:480 start_codon:yes stop_codon:yes gene_type:complete